MFCFAADSDRKVQYLASVSCLWIKALFLESNSNSCGLYKCGLIVSTISFKAAISFNPCSLYASILRKEFKLES